MFDFGSHVIEDGSYLIVGGSHDRMVNVDILFSFFCSSLSTTIQSVRDQEILLCYFLQLLFMRDVEETYNSSQVVSSV